MPLRVLLSAAFVIFTSIGAYAQFSFGVTPRLGYPFDLQQEGFYSAPSIGLSVDVSYELAKSNLFPSILYGFNNVQLPLYSKLYDELHTRAMINHVNLNLNYKLKGKESTVFVHAGLSVASVRPNRRSVETNVSNHPLVINSDGNKYLFPGINGGIQYMRQSKAFKSLYAGLEAGIMYINVFENTNYHVVNSFYYEDVLLPKHLLFPNIGIRLRYVLGT